MTPTPQNSTGPSATPTTTRYRQEAHIYWTFIVAEFKMFVRDRMALFWTFAFPLAFMFIFGLLNLGGDFRAPRVAIVDEAGNAASAGLVAALAASPNMAEVIEVELIDDLTDARLRVLDNDFDALLTIPQDFGAGSPTAAQLRIESTENELPQAAAAVAIVDDVLNELFVQVADVPERYRLANWAQVSMADLPVPEDHDGDVSYDYTSFVVTGIVAMAIWQSGIFSVAFNFVRLRKQGVLRRFKASPVGPAHFLVGMVATRAVIIIFSALAMLALGDLILDYDVAPGRPIAWLEVALLAIVSVGAFIALGLVVSSVAASENSAAPLASGISTPMLFLSGIFFPLETLPDWLSAFTQYLPLTFLADALREVVVVGEPLWQQGPELAGLAAWAVAIFIVAVRVFRWE